MKTMLKRFIPCLLIVLSIFTIVSCKGRDQYKYPAQVPLYTDNGTFVKVGNLNVTNQDVYNRLIQSYGVEEIQNIIDKDLLKDVTLSEKDEKDFQEQMTELKYGTKNVDELTDEEKQEALNKFKVDLASNGLHFEKVGENDDLYYENYYRLDYKRYIKTLEVLTQEIKEFDAKVDEDNKNLKEGEKEKEHFFKDADYLSYFTSNFHKKYNLIIVTFDSEKEAKDALKAVNVNTNKLAGAWEKVSDNKAMTEAEIKDAFMNLYEKAYGKVCEGAKEYTFNDLTKFASSASKDNAIANRALKFETGEYTHGPLMFGSRYFLMYAENVSADFYNDVDETIKFTDSDKYIAKKDANNNVTEITEELQKELADDLVINSIGTTSTKYENTINRVMFELRQKAGLEIFAEGLENTYKTNYASTFKALDITEYDPFNATKNTSSTEVCKWNSGSITTQAMFDALTNRYGALITLLFVQQHVVLTSEHNKVVDYITGKVLDQKAYDKYVKKDLTAYKESFEEGNFATYGYPASYGWENFLRDYIGLTNEQAIIVDFNSTLYDDTLALYTKAIYMAEVGDVEVIVLTDAEGNKTWGLKSAKWKLSHDTKVKVLDENKKPTVTLAWDKADIEGLPDKDADGKAIVYNTNDYYGHFILNFDNAKFLTNVTTDQAVMEVYDDVYAESFSATASGVYAYYDADLDGVADEVKEADATLAKELVDALWDAAKHESVENTIAENLTKVVREYQLANYTSEWAKFKKAGLRATVISNATYSNSSNEKEEILDLIKKMWTDVVNYKDEFGTSTSITGQTLDPIYRYVKNNKVFTVSAYEFADKYSPIYSNNGYYQFGIVKASSRTAYEYSTSTKTQKPSLYLYEQYQLDSDDRDVTINCSSQITSYYKPAIARLSSADIVNKKLMTECKDLLASVKFTNNHEQQMKTLTFIIDEAIKELNNK